MLIETTIVMIVLIAMMRIVMTQFKCSRNGKSLRTMIVMGSGGHTHEMMAMVSALNLGQNDQKYTPITFIIANDDHLSREKVINKYDKFSDCHVITIKRSRSVGQSYVTSVWTTLWSLIEAIYICIKFKPQLLLCNGPGTCIPICFAARLLRSDVIIVFIESVCRTKTLSLSGKIIYSLRLADEFIVQWPHMKQKYQRTQYFGILV